jgi:hypothetical protein
MRVIGQMIEQFRRGQPPIRDAEHRFQPLKSLAHEPSPKVQIFAGASKAAPRAGKLATGNREVGKKNMRFQSISTSIF